MDPAEQPYYQSSQPTSKLKRKKLLLNGFDLLKFILIVLAMVFAIRAFAFQTYEVYGQSMQPTLSPGDRLIISRIGQAYATVTNQPYIPKRGEIIVFHDPGSSDIQIIKRVVALPGERVVLRDGEIRVFNDDYPGGLLPDELVDVEFDYTNGAVDLVVPDDSLFVVGDNRNPGASLDSRNDLGTVPEDFVVGNLVLRLIPFSQLRWF